MSCASPTTGGIPIETAARSGSYCVERHPQDGRDLAKIVAAALRREGIDAFSEREGQCPAGARYHVTYIDSWTWDLRNYLAKFTLEAINAETGEVLAYGESLQPSLVALGSSHADVIDRAVAELLGDVP